ncbi:hypothetical protein TrVE_jg4555 [Triparma verrucosa]|uniref:Trafficking protein particle complex subunit n=2 Tax=Triparma TaxID=722752 RepID=A0A9W7BJF8_9STRA|nr:hypothetical protein TrST_g6203 [Triparma strigata]GMH96997.1 hypothetical protein TrVE_jg4555 [Triparma verrucosa]
MSYLSLLITSRSGGLIFHTPLSPHTPPLQTNDWLRIGSTFHSLIAISKTATPTTTKEGITKVTCDNINISILSTPTGIKFYLVSDANVTNPPLNEIYAAWSDWVLKNPFYEIDMPVRGERFRREVERICGYTR